MKLRFLKNNIRNKRFDYQPMYYDERKEKLRQKVDEYEELHRGDSLSDDKRMHILREKMANSWQRTSRENRDQAYSIRLIVLIGLILALGYFLLNGVDEVDVIVKRLW